MMENDRPPAAPVTLGVSLSAPGDEPPVRPGPPLSEADFLAVRQAAIEYSVVCRTVARAKRSAAITLTIGANPSGGTLTGTLTRSAVNGVRPSIIYRLTKPAPATSSRRRSPA